MKIIHFLTLHLLIAWLVFATQLNAQVQFRSFQSVESIMQAAQNENKGILIDGYTDWCYWCKVLDRKVFADTAIGDLINKYFIPVKLNMETDSTGVLVARKYCIRGYPSVLIINNNGRLVSTLFGYNEPEEYIKRLEKVIIRLQNDSFISGYTANFYLPYHPLYLAAYRFPHIQREYIDSIAYNSFLASQSDWASETNYVLLKANIYDINDANLETLFTHSTAIKTAFGADDYNDLLYNSIGIRIQSALADKNKNMMEKWLDVLGKSVDHDISKTRMFYLIEYFKSTSDYNAIVSLIKAKLKEDLKTVGNDRLNDIAWHLYEHCTDQTLLREAIEWMKNPVLTNSYDYEYLDTYAALLYKTKQIAEARKQAHKAIELGKKQGNETESTQQLLKKIEASQKQKK